MAVALTLIPPARNKFVFRATKCILCKYVDILISITYNSALLRVIPTLLPRWNRTHMCFVICILTLLWRIRDSSYLFPSLASWLPLHYTSTSSVTSITPTPPAHCSHTSPLVPAVNPLFVISAPYISMCRLFTADLRVSGSIPGLDSFIIFLLLSHLFITGGQW